MEHSKPVRIILTGAQGTGKTTLLNMFEMNKITEVVRNLNKKHNIPVNQDGTDEGQLVIWNAYKELLTQQEYISDRGLTDVLAYTEHGFRNGKVSERIYNIFKDEFDVFTRDNPDILYVYCPIEFDIVGDGFRSIDMQYQREIDQIICDLLESSKVQYITVSGSPEERAEMIVNHLKKMIL